MTVAGTAQQAGHQARNSEWLDHAVRVGLVSYGVVHLLIAWLAARLALGDDGRSASSKGALHTLAESTPGRISLYVAAAGLFALVVWQLLEAAIGHRAEQGHKRTFKRFISLAKVVIYGGLGVSAIKVATGSSSKGRSADSASAQLMSMPAGPLLVGAVGVVIIVVAGFLAHRGWKEKFLTKLDGSGKTGNDGTAYRWFGKIGYIAKGAALLVIGGLFIWAAMSHDPEKSGGLDQALHQLVQAPFGPALLLGVAAGIACYGLFCFAWARHLDR